MSLPPLDGRRAPAGPEEDGSRRARHPEPAAAGRARLAALFAGARRAVAFTGAGVSTESGIPDFRSPGGIWSRVDPRELTYQNFIGSVEGRRRYWALGRELYPVIRAAAPGPSHVALAGLHGLGRLDCCITQNIDDLHQRAGLPPEGVIELHGNATRAHCLDCGHACSRDALHARLEAGVEVPGCPACGGLVKPGTILFGEAMPEATMQEAWRRTGAADLFVVLGSSLIVHPAAFLPRHARRTGATLVIVNLEPTPLDGEADLLIRDRTGPVMQAVLDEVRARRPQGG